jgi:DNA-binding NarL/FixJ family response regulator
METAAPRVTCLLVDDHPAVLRALELVLTDEDIDVVGRASSGSEALEALERVQPAVALVDLVLPDISGIEVVRRAAETSPTTSCILYTAHAHSAGSAEALDAGARGVVSKEAPLADVSRAIRQVAAGRRYVDPALAGELAARGERPALTQREREVLRGLAEGYTHAEIGAQLFLSAETVRGHVRSATTRLGARSRTHAVVMAVREGLLR